MKKEYIIPEIKLVLIPVTLLNVGTTVLNSEETPLTDSDDFGARENTNFDLWEE